MFLIPAMSPQCVVAKPGVSVGENQLFSFHCRVIREKKKFILGERTYLQTTEAALSSHQSNDNLSLLLISAQNNNQQRSARMTNLQLLSEFCHYLAFLHGSWSCESLAFQGQGHCHVTIPIVFPANQKQSFKQVRDRPKVLTF